MVCVIKHTATLTGSLFTLHACQIRIDLPTLSDKDKEVSQALQSQVMFVFPFHAEDTAEIYKFGKNI